MRFERLGPSLVVSGAILAGAVVVSAVVLRASADVQSTIRTTAVTVQSTAGSQARLDALTKQLEEVVREFRRQAVDDSRKDIGPSIPQDGEEFSWDSDQLPLGASGFVACAGPLRDLQAGASDAPEVYRLEVEEPSGTGLKVWFAREFAVADLPKDTLRRRIADIVSYDEKTRTVTFRFGERVEKYELPPR